VVAVKYLVMLVVAVEQEDLDFLHQHLQFLVRQVHL
jgi:hypothetical protein